MTNLGWGLQIAALGMGLVFGLLALLWGLLTLALRLDAPAPAREEPQAEPAPAPLDPAVVAAITMAVLAHSAQHRAQASPQVRIHWPGSLLHASRWVAAGRTRQTQTWHRGR